MALETKCNEEFDDSVCSFLKRLVAYLIIILVCRPFIQHAESDMSQAKFEPTGPPMGYRNP